MPEKNRKYEFETLGMPELKMVLVDAVDASQDPTERKPRQRSQRDADQAKQSAVLRLIAHLQKSK